MGPVIGITPSQASRNTLAAGVAESYNSAQFLGHLPGQRGARGPVGIGPGALLLIDEASMISNPDLADLISHAEARGAKVILAGDTGQLQAVENGGGMSLLAGVLGYVQLAEPVRFRADWERAASLRLRDGDVSVLADYDQHGRISGGDPEQMMDAAAKAYVALTLEGKDTLLMAADHARRQELSRRIRDDLIHLGLVDAGPAVRIADGATASAGDLIVCTRNDHSVEAGEPGRTLANGDLLRIEAVTERGLIVRRALDADPQTGQRRWTDRNFVYRDYRNSELGYAVTDHVAQSRTVHTGLALITGTEDRQHAYVALSRGTDDNLAYVFTVSPKLADPAPGPRPAPELPRYDRIRAERDGQPAPAAATAGTGEALGVLADVLERDGQQLSATETRQRNLSNADHLAILNAMWAGETTAAREQRYRDMLTRALPPAYRAEPSHQAKWLWQTLRAAELAGLDAAAGPRRGDRRAGPRRIAGRGQRHRRPDPGPDQPPHPAASRALVRADPRHRRPRTQGVRRRGRGDDGCPQGADRRARRRARPPMGGQRPRPGARTPAGPAGLAAPGQRHRRLPRAVRLRPPHRADRARTRARTRPTSGPPGTRPSPPSAPSTGPTCGACRTGRCCTCATPTPSKPPGRPKWVGDELRQVRGGAEEAHLAAVRADAEAQAASSRGQHEVAAQQADAGRQLPGHARRLPRARERVRRRHGRPGRMGAGHRPATAPGRGRRRRTAPPPPRPAVRTTALRRTRASDRGPARRAHPDGGRGDHRNGPVDQGPGSRTPARSPTGSPNGRA